MNIEQPCDKCLCSGWAVLADINARLTILSLELGLNTLMVQCEFFILWYSAACLFRNLLYRGPPLFTVPLSPPEEEAGLS